MFIGDQKFIIWRGYEDREISSSEGNALDSFRVI